MKNPFELYRTGLHLALTRIGYCLSYTSVDRRDRQTLQGRILRALSVASGALGLAGCHQPAQPTTPTLATVQDGGEADFEALWESCLAVLRAHHFQIDRKDLRAGVITTLPQTSQHFFEFWRHDVDTAYDFAEASVQTMRRWVRIRIQNKPSEASSDRMIDVEVNKERLHSVERRITNSAAALRIFSPETPAMAGERYDPERDRYWAPQGRDGAMERYLLNEILSHGGLGSPGDT